MKYRKKPVVIEAVQWFKIGDHPSVRQFYKGFGGLLHCAHPDKCPECGLPADRHGWIETLEGLHRVCPADFIITGVEGEEYPCKPRIFTKTYEPLKEGE
jgi:hypothetical protein